MPPPKLCTLLVIDLLFALETHAQIPVVSLPNVLNLFSLKQKCNAKIQCNISCNTTARYMNLRPKLEENVYWSGILMRHCRHVNAHAYHMNHLRMTSMTSVPALKKSRMTNALFFREPIAIPVTTQKNSNPESTFKGKPMMSPYKDKQPWAPYKYTPGQWSK